VPVTKLDESKREARHLWPHFLPDGKHFLYTAVSLDPRQGGIYLTALDGSPPKLVIREMSNAQYVTAGYVLYARSGTLLAQRFDLARAEPVGEPARIAERVQQNVLNGGAVFAASDAGVLAFRSGTFTPTTTRLVWRNRHGTDLGTIGSPAGYRNPRLSPD